MHEKDPYQIGDDHERRRSQSNGQRDIGRDLEQSQPLHVSPFADSETPGLIGSIVTTAISGNRAEKPGGPGDIQPQPKPAEESREPVRN